MLMKLTPEVAIPTPSSRSSTLESRRREYLKHFLISFKKRIGLSRRFDFTRSRIMQNLYLKNLKFHFLFQVTSSLLKLLSLAIKLLEVQLPPYGNGCDKRTLHKEYKVIGLNRNVFLVTI